MLELLYVFCTNRQASLVCALLIASYVSIEDGSEVPSPLNRDGPSRKGEGDEAHAI